MYPVLNFIKRVAVEVGFEYLTRRDRSQQYSEIDRWRGGG